MIERSKKDMLASYEVEREMLIRAWSQLTKCERDHVGYLTQKCIRIRKEIKDEQAR
mgnify:FL=1